jgi:RND family efflux transporter MFP subunit
VIWNFHRITITLGGATILTVAGCGKESESPQKPAKVEMLPRETELARVTLSPEAFERLGITTVAVAKEAVPRHKVIGGDVTIPQGKTIVVSAPVSGTVTVREKEAIPLPGEWVEAGTRVLTLVPLLSPERDVPTPAERVQIANTKATLLSALTVATGEVARSQAEVDAAQITLDRAEKLFTDKAGSKRDVDDAKGQLNVSEANLKAAQEREHQLSQLANELATSTDPSHIRATPLSVTAPQTGVLRNLAVSPGQTVNAGATLFEVVDTSRMWIRAPVYVGLLQEIEAGVMARIVDLDGRAGFAAQEAKPVQAPPSADPLSATADLYFETDNKDKQLRPGQRVAIELRLHGSDEALVVPAKAILYDTNGGTWVYVNAEERAFERQRVAVKYMLGERAVLENGPADGTKVVVDGAAELFGTEFGIGK